MEGTWLHGSFALAAYIVNQGKDCVHRSESQTRLHISWYKLQCRYGYVSLEKHKCMWPRPRNDPTKNETNDYVNFNDVLFTFKKELIKELGYNDESSKYSR